VNREPRVRYNRFVAVTQQFKQKHYYGYGDVIYKGDFSKEQCSCVGGPEENGRIRCNLRTSRGCTCVRILEELLTVIDSCVLNFECNKVPL
jgi:hypothetical protein